MNWEDVRAFVAVHEAGSFAAAGRVLDVDATTVARRLGSLEADLGTPVLTRTPDGLVATPTGQGLLLHGERMAHIAQLAERDARGEAARLEGRVRLAVNDELATAFLVKELACFHEQHPRIELDLVSSTGFADLSRGEADIAIRFGRPDGGIPGVSGQGDLRAQRIGSTEVSVFVSEAYLERRGHPGHLNEVAGHDIIMSGDEADWMPGYEWMQRVVGRNRVTMRANTVNSMRAACVAGFGMCAMPAFVAIPEKTLVHLSTPHAIDLRSVWLLMPGELKRVARVRAVHEFLADLFDAPMFRSTSLLG